MCFNGDYHTVEIIEISIYDWARYALTPNELGSFSFTFRRDESTKKLEHNLVHAHNVSLIIQTDGVEYDIWINQREMIDQSANTFKVTVATRSILRREFDIPIQLTPVEEYLAL